MNIDRRRSCVALGGLLLAPFLAQANTYRTIGWDDLVPKDWNPWAGFQGVDMTRLKDDDPRAAAALQKLRKTWDDAPLVAAIDGAAVRIPGYVVPLEQTANGMQELLLVPHFGACIHTPPPPANQIIHVRLDKPTKSLSSMDTVWISGKLKALRSESMHGVSGYAMAGVRVERYVAPKR
jgi:hypothetical protein